MPWTEEQIDELIEQVRRDFALGRYFNHCQRRPGLSVEATRCRTYLVTNVKCDDSAITEKFKSCRSKACC
jgi:hypothetical protein